MIQNDGIVWLLEDGRKRGGGRGGGCKRKGVGDAE